MNTITSSKGNNQGTVEPESPAVAFARAHAEAWSNHDWEKARKMLSSQVHVTATSTQALMEGSATDLTGIDAYMEGLIQFAQAIEPGSARIIGSVGDDHNSLILLTVQVTFQPGAPKVTLPAARLALW